MIPDWLGWFWICWWFPNQEQWIWGVMDISVIPNIINMSTFWIYGRWKLNVTSCSWISRLLWNFVPFPFFKLGAENHRYPRQNPKICILQYFTRFLKESYKPLSESYRDRCFKKIARLLKRLLGIGHCQLLAMPRSGNGNHEELDCRCNYWELPIIWKSQEKHGWHIEACF